MASPKIITIKESLKELKSLYRKATPFLSPRLRVLIILKEHESEGISKRAVSTIVGVSSNSVQQWRKLYEKGGIKGILSHNKKGFKPSIFTKEEHKAIEEKLNDNKNGLRGYVELLSWIENEFKKEVKYNTLLKYSIRKFGSKIKVARKSHIKKDEQAVEAFKKTSVKSAKHQSQRQKKNTEK